MMTATRYFSTLASPAWFPLSVLATNTFGHSLSPSSCNFALCLLPRTSKLLDIPSVIWCDLRTNKWYCELSASSIMLQFFSYCEILSSFTWQNFSCAPCWLVQYLLAIAAYFPATSAPKTGVNFVHYLLCDWSLLTTKAGMKSSHFTCLRHHESYCETS